MGQDLFSIRSTYRCLCGLHGSAAVSKASYILPSALDGTSPAIFASMCNRISPEMFASVCDAEVLYGMEYRRMALIVGCKAVPLLVTN